MRPLRRSLFCFITTLSLAELPSCRNSFWSRKNLRPLIFRKGFMKILCLADFHISTWLEAFVLIEKIQKIPCVYDVVVIAGDLFERNFLEKNDPYQVLRGIFSNLPVIFCLGNHECIRVEYEQVLNVFRRRKANIHCLDVEGNIQIGDFNFIGNALWYDDSMSIYSRKPLTSSNQQKRAITFLIREKSLKTACGK